MPNVLNHWNVFHTKEDPLQPRESWKSKRLLAFPIHTSNPGHWTLAVAINHSWNVSPKRAPQIDVFHFDSFPDSPQHRKKAEKFARYAFQLEKGNLCRVIEVAVPRQTTWSNDCGLYPSHFLKIFLSDVEKALSVCMKVSNLHIAQSYLNFHSSTC
jgi:Ulp1 family protease